jgi:hypothetical protein
VRIIYKDNNGSKRGIYFNPQVFINGKGRVVINSTAIYVAGKKYEMPQYEVYGSEIWLDYNNGRYQSDHVRESSPGTFKVAVTEGDTITVLRYRSLKDRIGDIF